MLRKAKFVDSDVAKSDGTMNKNGTGTRFGELNWNENDANDDVQNDSFLQKWLGGS